jgi:hypothetical protein
MCLLLTTQQAWGELAAKIAAKAQAKGYLKTDNVASLSNEEIAKINRVGAILWGSNSRGTASRARKFLGWKPVGPPLDDTLDDLIDSEAKSLGL